MVQICNKNLNTFVSCLYESDEATMSSLHLLIMLLLQHPGSEMIRKEICSEWSHFEAIACTHFVLYNNPNVIE